MKTQQTKIEAMKKLEAAGLSFTANVIMTGCSKPTTTMNAILKLISLGHNVRQAQFDCYTMVVDGEALSFSQIRERVKAGGQ